MTLINYLYVIALSVMPISELRGAIPVGVGLGMTPLNATILSVIANMSIVPILLIITKPLFTYLRKYKFFGELIERFENRALKKVKNFKKYELLGLYVLVALPIPTTGAYTGIVAAGILNIKFKNALLAIVLGVLTAGIIVFTIVNGFTLLAFSN
ncbi:COG2426 family protein [Helicovermis profundi]|uniref:Small multi-drug export protein n=1 Tax=Helicovermis profundi TaxID=3065157 RepID=A0AAU9E812_9FIRM|nr:small multi-drug export protein [Clostridia bacterium S502]